MKYVALRTVFVTQVNQLFVAPKNNSLLAKLLSDALAPAALGLIFRPYRGLHVA